jgi:molybdopterin biosynthesis enzyme MoaB
MNAIYTAAVITVSDRGYRGEREDQSGPMLRRMLADRDGTWFTKSPCPTNAR